MKGFTLIELSIVLVLVALIVAGITGGRTLIRTAELNSVIADVAHYKSMVASFDMKYHGLPGDIRNPFEYWPNDVPGAPLIYMGNGNRQINSQDPPSPDERENAQAWLHMYRAEMVSGSFDGVPPLEIGRSVPPSKIEGGGYTFWFSTFYGHEGNAIVFGKEGGSGLFNAVINTRDAVVIDTKSDDGSADTGKVIGAEAWDSAVGTCVTSPGGGLAPSAYILSNKEVKCYLWFWID